MQALFAEVYAQPIDASLIPRRIAEMHAAGAPAIVAATPQAIVARLNRELARVLAQPALGELLATDGSRVYAETPAQFGAFLKNEIAKWQRVVREAGITAG